MPAASPLRERFEQKYMPEPMSGCWLWIAAVDKAGYGRIGESARVLYAHRVAYEFYKGEIGAGLTLDHKCRNRQCVNPDHLDPVTHQENVRRGIAGDTKKMACAAMTHCTKGHPRTEKNVRLIHKPNGGIERVCRPCTAARARLKKAERSAVNGH